MAGERNMLNDVDNKNLLQSGSGALTVSGTNTYTAGTTPALTAYVTGQPFLCTFTNANTGAATLNIDGLGAKSITKNSGQALELGDIRAGQIMLLAYDGTNFQIVNHSSYVKSAYLTGPAGTFIPGYAGTATTYAYAGGLATSVHLGSGTNQQATRTYTFRLPDDFLAFKHIHVGTYRFNAVDTFTVTMKKTPAFPHLASATGTNDSTITALNVLPVANDTHIEWIFVPGSTYTAGDTVAVQFTSQVDNGEYAEISFVQLDYYSK